MANDKTTPPEPPLNVPTMPEMIRLGIVSNPAIEMENLSEEKQIELNAKAHMERIRERRGEREMSGKKSNTSYHQE